MMLSLALLLLSSNTLLLLLLLLPLLLMCCLLIEHLGRSATQSVRGGASKVHMNAHSLDQLRPSSPGVPA
jgi:hypothetical protein